MKRKGRHLNRFRKRHPQLGASPPDSLYGYFVVPFNEKHLAVISSGEAHSGINWEHVSVSLPDRCPTWEEMCHVKDLFWGEHETVIQFHPRKSNYVNNHQNCLHLWRNSETGHQLPPTEYV